MDAEQWQCLPAWTDRHRLWASWQLGSRTAYSWWVGKAEPGGPNPENPDGFEPQPHSVPPKRVLPNSVLPIITMPSAGSLSILQVLCHRARLSAEMLSGRARISSSPRPGRREDNHCRDRFPPCSMQLSDQQCPGPKCFAGAPLPAEDRLGSLIWWQILCSRLKGDVLASWDTQKIRDLECLKMMREGSGVTFHHGLSSSLSLPTWAKCVISTLKGQHCPTRPSSACWGATRERGRKGWIWISL